MATLFVQQYCSRLRFALLRLALGRVFIRHETYPLAACLARAADLKSIIATNTLVVVALFIATILTLFVLTVTAFGFGGAIREVHKNFRQPTQYPGK
jgi:hypothetical protein